LDALGTVPQVFGVVQKYEEKYRLGFFSRPTIKPYDPAIPALHLFPREELKDFLFTKVYNGYCQALSCPPMNRLFEVPRANTIAEIVAKFPNESKKARKIRSHGAQKRMNLITTSIKDQLFLMITVIRALPPSNPKCTNTYVSVKILDQEQKTKVIKAKEKGKPSTDALIWEKADGKMAFNVVAVDPALHFVKLELRNMSKTGLNDRVIAQTEIPFVKICSKLGSDQWIELDQSDKSTISSPSNSFTSSLASLATSTFSASTSFDVNSSTNSSNFSNSNSTSSSSSIVCLQFDLVGPASVLCPYCKLFLGALDIVIFKEKKYHTRCIVCSVCNKALISEEWVQRSEKFFCRKCYGKTVSDDVSFDEQLSSQLNNSNTSGNSSNSNNTGSNSSGNTSSIVVTGGATSIDKMGDKHVWESTTFKALSWCGFCGDHMGLGAHGFSCSECKYPVHKECKDQVPANCNHNPKNPELHSTIPSEVLQSVVAKTKQMKKAVTSAIETNTESTERKREI